MPYNHSELFHAMNSMYRSHFGRIALRAIESARATCMPGAVMVRNQSLSAVIPNSIGSRFVAGQFGNALDRQLGLDGGLACLGGADLSLRGLLCDDSLRLPQHVAE